MEMDKSYIFETEQKVYQLFKDINRDRPRVELAQAVEKHYTDLLVFYTQYIRNYPNCEFEYIHLF